MPTQRFSPRPLVSAHCPHSLGSGRTVCAQAWDTPCLGYRNRVGACLAQRLGALVSMYVMGGWVISPTFQL